MNRILLVSTLAAGLGLAGAAAAAPSSTSAPFSVTGNVPSLCSGGVVTGGSSVFALGVMIDTSTGLLLNNLSAPPKTLTGAFCNGASTLSVAATPMVASSFTGTPPTGFSNQVDYTTTASGWTTTAAAFTTDAAANPAATQNQPAAFTGTITVAVSGFTPVGGNTLRMVSDPNYVGNITITLAVAS